MAAQILSDGGARQEGPVRGGANDRTAVGRPEKQDVNFRHRSIITKRNMKSSLTLPR
jgi:hypothetical protein